MQWTNFRIPIAYRRHVGRIGITVGLVPILLPSAPIGSQRFQNIGKNSVSSIIGSYKSVVTKHAHRLGFAMEWQERFHDHVIRDEGEYQRIADYIRNNPRKWKNDRFF